MIDEIDRAVIERITGLLKKNDMTALELTERLGVNPSTVSEWRKGKTRPSVSHVRKIAEIFGVTTDYIINGNETRQMLSAELIEGKLDMTMADVFKRLSTEHKNAVRDFFYLCLRELENKSFKIDEDSTADNQTRNNQDKGYESGASVLEGFGIDFGEEDDSDVDPSGFEEYKKLLGQ